MTMTTGYDDYDDNDNGDVMMMTTTKLMTTMIIKIMIMTMMLMDLVEVQPENKNKTKQNKKQPKHTIVQWTYPDRHLKLSCGFVSKVSTGRYDTTPSYPLQQDQTKKSVSVSRSRGFQSRPDQLSGPQSNKICPGMPSIDQFRYFQIQLLTTQFSKRLGGINHTKNVFYSPEPRAEVYCLQLNFKISKMAYHIHGYLNKRHTMFPDPFR